jgi:hypothetical protein
MVESADAALIDTLAELQRRLPQAQEVAAKAKVDWDRAVNTLATLQQTINSIEAYLAATEARRVHQFEDTVAAALSSVGTLTMVKTDGSRLHSGRRSRHDVVTIMEEDESDAEWTIEALVEAFAARRWSLYMERPASAIKSMLSRLVADGHVERVKPGVFRLKHHPKRTDGGDGETG